MKKYKARLSGAARIKKWRKLHPEKVRAAKERTRATRREIKTRVLTHYGNGTLGCVKCGFGDIRALSIDHIDKDEGVRFRTSTELYRYLEKNSFPKGYQTLCMNCQWIKRVVNKEYF